MWNYSKPENTQKKVEKPYTIWNFLFLFPFFFFFFLENQSVVKWVWSTRNKLIRDSMYWVVIFSFACFLILSFRVWRKLLWKPWRISLSSYLLFWFFDATDGGQTINRWMDQCYDDDQENEKWDWRILNSHDWSNERKRAGKRVGKREPEGEKQMIVCVGKVGILLIRKNNE